MEQLILKSREERRLLRGHLWVYRNELAAPPKLPDGALVDVFSDTARLVGRGFYQAEGGIAVRLFARKDVAVDEAFFQRRVARALRFREQLYPGETAYRWLHGESDGLPGLVADRYGAVVALQTACGFYRPHMEVLAQAMLATDGVRGVRFEAPGETRWFGERMDHVEITVSGLQLGVDLEEGQKTGMFLDQRDNTLAAMRLARGARVFDGHCHTGQWSCRMALAGADSVVGVDSSARAIEGARRNAERNGLSARCRFETGDVEKALAGDTRYGLVLMDPPSLAKSRAQATRALGVYQALNRAAMAAVEPGGYLVTSTCSHHVSREVFLEAIKRASRSLQRDVWVLEVRGASADHPVLLAMPETAYLTSVTLRVF